MYGSKMASDFYTGLTSGAWWWVVLGGGGGKISSLAHSGTYIAGFVQQRERDRKGKIRRNFRRGKDGNISLKSISEDSVENTNTKDENFYYYNLTQ